MKPTGNDLDAVLAKAFGWRLAGKTLDLKKDCWRAPDGKIHFEPPTFTAEQIAAELRKQGYEVVEWGFRLDYGHAIVSRDLTTWVEEYCNDLSIPELDRPRTALGWLALEVANS